MTTLRDTTVADFNTRLRRLLDCVQQVHGVKRSVANRIVGNACGIAPRYVSNLSTNCVRIGKRPPLAFRYDGLAALELRYARPLRLLRAFEAACQREQSRTHFTVLLALEVAA